MTPFWKEAPLLRILLPLLFGILLYFIAPTQHWIVGISLCLIFGIIALACRFLKESFQLNYQFIRGVNITAACVCFGYFSCILNNVQSNSRWYYHNLLKTDYVKVRLSEEPQMKPKTIKLTVEVLNTYSKNKASKTCGEALVYLQKSDAALNVKEGDVLLIKNKFSAIAKSGNPGAFSYADYCKSKNIFQSAFVKSNEWRPCNEHIENLHSMFDKANAFTRARLKKYIPDSSSAGMAEALLIGYRNDIDNDVCQAYSNTGIVHIIAISGMHMAMIFTSARWLLFLVPFMKKRKALSISLSLLFMWLFACLTGLPPSVTRAAIMFTFIGMGDIFQKEQSIINNLAASAFFLLCINPSWLQDVGFQLSYLAVFSLILFYSTIYNWLYCGNKLIDAIWKLLSGTIAAQILTFPLCVYYFHQFPMLFLLTNLIAVPATTLLLFAEIILLFVSWLRPLAKVIGLLISYGIMYLNKIVYWFSTLSFAVWNQLSISKIQVVLLYLVIVFLSIWLLQKKKKSFIFTLCILFAFVTTLCWKSFQVNSQGHIVVYQMQKQRALEFIDGSNYFSPDNDSIIKSSNNLKYVIQPAHIAFGLKNSNPTIVNSVSKNGIELFSFKQKKIVRIQNLRYKFKQCIEVDVLILSYPCFPTLQWIQQNIKAKQLLLDSSYPFWKSSALKDSLRGLQIPIHSVNEDGAFVIKM